VADGPHGVLATGLRPNEPKKKARLAAGLLR
jgi:hypothetical protein